MSKESCCKTFAALLFVLAAVRVSWNNKGDVLCTGLAYCIDCYEKTHNVIVYGKLEFCLSTVHKDFFVVFNVLENVNVFSADAFVKFALEFTIGKIGEGCVHLEYGRTVLFNVSTDAKVACVNVIVKVHLLNNFFLFNSIALCDYITLEGKTVFVHVTKMSDYFIGERFSTRTGNDSKVGWFRIRHYSYPL